MADRHLFVFAGPVTSWSGDDLAIVCLWSLTVVCTAWLVLTTFSCLAAAARGHGDLARRLARLAPPLARGALETALVVWVIVPTATYAGAAPAAPDVPVVRAPTTAIVDPPDAPRPAVAAAPTPHVISSPKPAPPPRTYAVRVGDNLWRIAAAEVTRAAGARRPDAEVARYWRRVIAANRATLRSRDPNLIYPGELVTLPGLDPLPSG